MGLTLAWILLICAGLFEVGWPLGFKLSSLSKNSNVLWISFSIICMAASGVLLYKAQKVIPMGTAYAVWTGVGAIGTFIIGVLFFNDSASILRVLSIILIALGIIGLRLS